MWKLIGAPDDADAFCETFSTKKAACERGAEIMSWENWDKQTAYDCLYAGKDCCLGDAGSIRVTK